MAIQTHPAFTGGSTPGDRWRAGLAVLGGLVVVLALAALGYTLGSSFVNHTQPRQAGTLVHASARAHPGHRSSDQTTQTESGLKQG
jgi:hypothetical protein